MSRLPRRSCLRAALAAHTSVVLVVPLFALAVSSGRAVGGVPLDGSHNTVTADPPVARPRTTPCVVQLFSDLQFTDFSPKSFSYAPPAHCAGPWAKVIFAGDFAVTAGRQYDRTASIWVGGASLYFGTTAEPSRTVAPSWHVERELLDYSALLAAPQTGRVEIGNLVNGTYTGIISASAQLLFYPLEPKESPPRLADVVLPMSAGPDGGTVALSTPGSQLARSFTLPRNIERAYLDVYAQSQASDEFWYTCVPSDVANELQSCPSTGFRETEVTIDGQPAGVAPIYPWIYTGGIDPYLWRPIPGVQTLAFVPYRVELTPFAGLLSDGRPHEVALSVYNTNDHFSITATLFLWLDHASKQVTGAITQNTLAAAPSPAVTENLATAKDGSIRGEVAVRSARSFKIAGYVHTSRGRIETTVDHELEFRNRQHFAISVTEYTQDIHQHTVVRSRIGTRHGGRQREVSTQQEWPLTVALTATTHPDKSSEQTTTIRQQYRRTDTTSNDGATTDFRTVDSVVTPSDTLSFDANGALIGNKDQRSSHHYFAVDSQGGCYSRRITAASGAVTTIEDGRDCE